MQPKKVRGQGGRNHPPGNPVEGRRPGQFARLAYALPPSDWPTRWRTRRTRRTRKHSFGSSLFVGLCRRKKKNRQQNNSRKEKEICTFCVAVAECQSPRKKQVKEKSFIPHGLVGFEEPLWPRHNGHPTVVAIFHEEKVDQRNQGDTKIDNERLFFFSLLPLTAIQVHAQMQPCQDKPN